MKQLQNNFTTPEQSKRLLELGVPANSADCTLKKRIEDGGYSVYWIAYIEDFIGPVKVDSILPCWSAGRLIEIYNECWCGSICDSGIFIPLRHIVLQRVLIDFFGAAENGELDFSKLEE